MYIALFFLGDVVQFPAEGVMECDFAEREYFADKVVACVADKGGDENFPAPQVLIVCEWF